MKVTQSILLTIKKMLGIAEEYHAFDIDILTNINAVFLTLNQLGIGPDKPYQIKGEDEEWQDFLDEQYEYLAAVQTYIYQRVRLLFDPPTNSFLVDAIQKSCQEFEWRFTVQPKNESDLNYVNSFKTEHASKKEDAEADTDDLLRQTSSNASSQSKTQSLYDIFS